MVARSGGGSGGLWGCGGLRARGQGNACGVAGKWAEPTAGERARARGMGWGRFFWWVDPMLRLLALPCCFFGAPLPSRCWRGAEGGVLVGVGMGGGGGFWLWKRWRCSMRPFCRPRSQGSMDVLSVLSGEGGDRCSGSQCFSGKRGRCGGMDQGERSAAMDPEGSPRSDAPG